MPAQKAPDGTNRDLEHVDPLINGVKVE